MEFPSFQQTRKIDMGEVAIGGIIIIVVVIFVFLILVADGLFR